MRTWRIVCGLWLSIAIVSGAPLPDRFVLVLEGEPLAATARKTAAGWKAAESEEGRLAARQNALANRVEAAGGRVLDRLTFSGNALIVEAAGSSADWLAALPGVRRVEPVQIVRMHLDAALSVHSIPEAWNLIGGDSLAGRGIKIAILDSGIDSSHPGFQDPGLPIPPGYPLVNDEADRSKANNKILVVRNYEVLTDLTNRNGGDQQGHGTSVAMVAAGVRHQTPIGPIEGVAPKAWLGSYKVFPGDAEQTSSDVVLKAFDDAVRDGMDVINMSLGTAVASRPQDSLLSEMIERASAAGVMVVASVGNSGPSVNTVSSAAIGPAGIAVGSIANARTRAASVAVGGTSYPAVPGNGPAPPAPVTAAIVDAATFDPSGLVCSPLSNGSLAGRIVLILRGVCNFSVKLDHARGAGAVGAVVYTDAARPEPITMAVDAATLPAQMVSYTNGLAIKSQLGAPHPSATLNFVIQLVERDPRQISSFSSRDPSSDLGVKPDLVAVGSELYSAALASVGGYRTISGTSFSAPMVAGAAAVLMAARPDYSSRQYRTLLVNASQPLVLAAGGVAGVQQAGAGMLNLERSMKAVIGAFPVSLGFGAGGADASFERSVTVENLGSRVEVVTAEVVALSGSAVPALNRSVLTLGPGEADTVRVRFFGAGLEPGEYQGLIRFGGTSTGIDLHVPYWYGRSNGVPRAIVLLDTAEEGRAGSLVRGAADFRVVDSAGVSILNVNPTVTVVDGGGSVVSVIAENDRYPGVYTATVRLGATEGIQRFRVEAGGVSGEFSITATRAGMLRAPLGPASVRRP